jgi:glutathione S-transferase
MITLYYHRGACSTANHFALEESGVEYQAFEVDLKALGDPLAMKLRALSPMAQTPIILLEDGTVLTQNMATLPFIADLVPEKNLFPASGTIDRVLAESWLSFVASDLHARMVEVSWIWSEGDEVIQARLRKFYEDRVHRPLGVLDDRLRDRDFILGDNYSVIDGYALIALGWSVPAQLSLAPYPNILEFMQRVEARPVIRKVRQMEGTLDWAADLARAEE